MLKDIAKKDILDYLNKPNGELLFNERDLQIHLATFLRQIGHYDHRHWSL